MRKPTVLTKCVANAYTGPDERIVEVSDRETGKGCLISIRRHADGRLILQPMRGEPGTVVWIAGSGEIPVPP